MIHSVREEVLRGLQSSGEPAQKKRLRGFGLLMGEGRAEKMIPSILREFGCTLKLIDDPGKQLQTIRTSLPDLMIVGTMGSMDSRLELCEQLGSFREHRHFPILLIVNWSEVQSTCLTGNDKLVHCVDDIIIAPFSVTELRFRLRNVIALRAKIGELEMLDTEYKVYRSKDDVTGLYSEGALFEHVHRELEHAEKYHTIFSCLRVGASFDLGARTDHGEEVLVARGLAELIKEQIRSADIAGRLDDNTLLVVASGADRFGATVLAEKLAEAIAKHSTQWANLVSDFAFGIGLVTFTGETSCGVAELVDAARHALDKAMSARDEPICAMQFGDD